jgi:hypothetical protein
MLGSKLKVGDAELPHLVVTGIGDVQRPVMGEWATVRTTTHLLRALSQVLASRTHTVSLRPKNGPTNAGGTGTGNFYVFRHTDSHASCRNHVVSRRDSRSARWYGRKSNVFGIRIRRFWCVVPTRVKVQLARVFHHLRLYWVISAEDPEINPADGQRFGINPNDCGQVRARAFLTPTIAPGQVFLPMHSKQPAYKACSVRVQRA